MMMNLLGFAIEGISDMSRQDELAGVNLDAPTIKVRHASLLSPFPSRRFVRLCPVCNDGLLMVTRDPQTLRIRSTDRCVLCGQAVEYDDIDRLRSGDWAEPPTGTITTR